MSSEIELSLQRSVGRLEGKIDMLFDEMKANAGRAVVAVEKAEAATASAVTRLRGVERQHWMLMGGLSVLMVLIQFLHH